MNQTLQIPRPEHPRPQFEREDWINLNGTWTFEFDFGHSGRDAGRTLYKSQGFDREITFYDYPRNDDYLPTLREKVNAEIMDKLGK